MAKAIYFTNLRERSPASTWIGRAGKSKGVQKKEAEELHWGSGRESKIYSGRHNENSCVKIRQKKSKQTKHWKRIHAKNLQESSSASKETHHILIFAGRDYRSTVYIRILQNKELSVVKLFLEINRKIHFEISMQYFIYQ